MSLKEQFKNRRNLSILLRAFTLILLVYGLFINISSIKEAFVDGALLSIFCHTLFFTFIVMYFFSILAIKEKLALFSLISFSLVTLYMTIYISKYLASSLSEIFYNFKNWFFAMVMLSLGYIGLLLRKKK